MTLPSVTRPQLITELSDGFPTVPNVSTLLPTGHAGWMKLFSANDVGLSGAVLYGQSGKPRRGQTKERKVSRPDGGENMRALTSSSAANVVVPVRPATCN